MRDVIRPFAAVTDALDSLPALKPGCGKDWHSRVPRFTPADKRSDLVLGFREGNGGGDGAFRGLLAGCTAKSTFVKRFDALTGGEEVGANCFGVSRALTLGTGYFPRGILGACRESFSGTVDPVTCLGNGGGLGLDRTPPGGVLGGVTSEKVAGVSSGSESKVMISIADGGDLSGDGAFFAFEVFVHEGEPCWGMGPFS